MDFWKKNKNNPPKLMHFWKTNIARDFTINTLINIMYVCLHLLIFKCNSLYLIIV